mgnify:CR=1 FL=1
MVSLLGFSGLACGDKETKESDSSASANPVKITKKEKIPTAAPPKTVDVYQTTLEAAKAIIDAHAPNKKTKSKNRK